MADPSVVEPADKVESGVSADPLLTKERQALNQVTFGLTSPEVAAFVQTCEFNGPSEKIVEARSSSPTRTTALCRRINKETTLYIY